MRRRGLTVSALDSRANGPGSSSSRGHCVVFLGRHFTHTVPLPTRVYKWAPAKSMLRVTLLWTSISVAIRCMAYCGAKAAREFKAQLSISTE